ncbi:MAG TPA: hypothetical protein V6C76_01715 [Drouetiella sp.]
MIISQLGGIETISFPDHWCERTIQDSVLRQGVRAFHPQENPQVRVCSVMAQVELSRPAQDALQKILYEAFHTLTNAEVDSLSEILQAMSNPDAFSLESSATGYLCDKRALNVSGQWKGTMEQDLSFFVDLHGDGKWTQHIYYVGAPGDFEDYKTEANEILQSIVWTRAVSTK